MSFRSGFWHSNTNWTDATQTRMAHATPMSLLGNITFYPCPCRACCNVSGEDRFMVLFSALRARWVRCALSAPRNITSAQTMVPAIRDEVDVRDIHGLRLRRLRVLSYSFKATDARSNWPRVRCLQRHVQGCRRHLVGKSKIMLSFYQVVLLSKTVYSVPFPQVFIDFMNKFSFLRFELFKLVPARCVAPFDYHDILDLVVTSAFILVLPPCVRVMQEYKLMPTWIACHWARVLCLPARVAKADAFLGLALEECSSQRTCFTPRSRRCYFRRLAVSRSTSAVSCTKTTLLIVTVISIIGIRPWHPLPS